MSRAHVCLYLVGEAPEEVFAEYGGYVDWFRRIAGDCEVELDPFDGMSGRMPSDIAEYDGIVITGSPASLTEPEPWMEAGVALIRQAAQQQAALLGVCFGHQMIGAAYGGSVIENPEGWELSTYTVSVNELGQEDPLFADLPASVDVNLSHRDIIDPDTLSHLNGIRSLASTPKTAVQALAAGPKLRGVQFHPEFDGAITTAYLDQRVDILRADAERRGEADDQPDKLAERIHDCPRSEQLFRNFLNYFVLSD